MSSKSSPARIGCAVALAALVALGVGAALRRSPEQAPQAQPSAERERFPNPWKAPPPADVAALLGGLGPATDLGAGWRVRGVSPVHEGRIVIDVERGEIGFRVWVMRRDDADKRPPARTKHYALFVVQPRPTGEAVDDEGKGHVLAALAARLRATEGRVPVPAGL